jgi:hypothetical protein
MSWWCGLEPALGGREGEGLRERTSEMCRAKGENGLSNERDGSCLEAACKSRIRARGYVMESRPHSPCCFFIPMRDTRFVDFLGASYDRPMLPL